MRTTVGEQIYGLKNLVGKKNRRRECWRENVTFGLEGTPNDDQREEKGRTNTPIFSDAKDKCSES